MMLWKEEHSETSNRENLNSAKFYHSAKVFVYHCPVRRERERERGKSAGVGVRQLSRPES